MTDAVKFTHLEHGPDFKGGARLLMLKSRHKDGWVGKERAILRQSKDVESFEACLDELRSIMRPAERIYASASARNIQAAGRLFAERLMNAMFDPPEIREEFFGRLPYHWWSSMMQPQTQLRDDKWWMWDCDDMNAYAAVKSFMATIQMGEGQYSYAYHTKSGAHILVRPFNRSLIPTSLGMTPDMNPLMLWSYAT